VTAHPHGDNDGAMQERQRQHADCRHGERAATCGLCRPDAIIAAPIRVEDRAQDAAQTPVEAVGWLRRTTDDEDDRLGACASCAKEFNCGAAGQPLRPFHRRDVVLRLLQDGADRGIMPKKKAPGGASHGKAQASRECGSTTFEPHIGGLLEIAGEENSPEARSELLLALQLAQADYEHSIERASRRRAPAKLTDQLIETIEKSLILLGKLKEYSASHHLGFLMHPVGRGIVDVATVEEMKRGRRLELPGHPSISDQELYRPKVDNDAMLAAINLEPLLRRLVFDARNGRRGRGNLKKSGKEGVVFYAAQYFHRHSPEKASTDPKNVIYEFTERFYEVVTKTKPDGLERQIRKVLAAMRSGH
jgi:hypothetical protein